VNIILLVSDTFRYDNLFDRAAMPVNTPELDRFASERAASMENCWLSSFPTIPHRTDLTTGRYGWPWYPWQSRMKSSPNHSPEVLRKSGFVSQLLCDCPHLFKTDFNLGFDAAMAVRGHEGDKYFLRMNHPIREVMPPEKTRAGDHFQGHNLPDIASWTNIHWRTEEDRLMAQTSRQAVDWLEENYKYDPFYIWVDFFDPHEPWDPPEYMVRKYDPDYDGTPMIHPNYGRASDLTEAELRNLRAHYCAEAELVDRWVGRVLQKIDDLDLWKNSIVVFTTDHGMSLGEHDRTGKSNINPGDDRIWPIYPEIAHIPLMIAAPGIAGGTKIHDFVQPPDILPTLIDLAGAKSEPPEEFHGKSFAAMLRGEEQQPLREFAVSGQFWRPGQKSGGVPNCSPVVYSREWAYAPIGAEKTPELFDLRSDPYAETNVAAEHPEVCKQMHEKLLGWLTEMNAPDEAVAVFRK
jgi:arylsulfatase A-like enzyme